MQSTAQLWLVYKLTNSAALLGVFGFANQIPILLLASIGGYVGDRYDRHRSVIATQTASMILAFVLAGLTLTGSIHGPRGAWVVIFIAFLVGIVNAFDVPIRQAFLVQMVGKEDLPNAIALNSSIFNGARVVGPAPGHGSARRQTHGRRWLTNLVDRWPDWAWSSGQKPPLTW